MKIYQVFKTIVWEEFDEEYNLREYSEDFLINSFISRDKAMALKKELVADYELELKTVEHCHKCPIHNMTKRKMNQLKNSMSVYNYCEQTHVNKPNIIFVNNMAICESCSKLPEETSYYIKELEVVE